ncbi:MAG: ABC transporter substrate-binding protein [Vicinamibacteria bacterium]|nr:ABC transporter substrate-binding protein [Vicinamibacteria bacterium]
MAKRRSIRFTIAATAMAGLAAACARPAPDVNAPGVRPVLVSEPAQSDGGALRVASIFPAVGRYALSGIQCTNGVRLAVNDVNRRGGVHGRKLQLLEYRTGSYFVDARHAAELAVDEGGVVAIIGANSSSLSLAIAEVAEQRRVVQISNISTAEELTHDPETGSERRHVFRTCGSDVVMGALLARFARKDLDARRVAVLYEVGSTYSARLAQSFIRNFRDVDAGRETREYFYLPREIDFRVQLREVAEFEPHAIFVPGFPTDATLIAIQAESLGLPATLLGGDGWSSRFLFARGGPSRPAYYADLCAPPEEFGARYARDFGHEAEGCRAVLAYDAVMALEAAARALGPLRDVDLGANLPRMRARLRESLTRVEIRGETGIVRFDRHRNRPGVMSIMEIARANGKGYTTRLRTVSDAT